MKKFGVGIIGTGWVSGEYFKAFQQNSHCEVLGITSRKLDRAKAIAAEHGLRNCGAFVRLSEMLREQDIQIIVVCTPHHLHPEQAIAAARAGKHVIVEKPIALDLAKLRKLEETVRAAGVKSIVSFVLRWNPMFANIRAMLDQKLIGDLFYAEVDYLHGVGPWYRLWNWHRRKAFGGSSLLTAGCHAVDGLRWFVRDQATEVSAYSNRSKKNPLKYEYDPNVVAIVKFANGAIGKVACSVECRMPYVFNVELFGDKGTIRNNRLYTTRWPGQTGWSDVPTVLPDSGDVSHHPFADEVNHFIDCIRRNKESHASVADAAKTHEICLAADRSATEGKPVRLPLKAR